MGAIVKLGTGRPLRVKGGEENFIEPNKDYMGVKIGKVEIVKLGGQDDLLVLESGIVEPKQSVLISPAIEMNPRSCQLLIGYNTALLKYGRVSCPSILNYYELEDLVLRYDAVKKTDFNKFKYIFQLFMID